MTDLIAFLTARLDEDESVARDAAHQVWYELGDSDNPENRWNVMYGGYDGIMVFPGPDRGTWSETEQTPTTRHIARHDPARVLRDVAAKRALLALHASSGGESPAELQCLECGEREWRPAPEDRTWPCPTIQALADAFSDHPDYDPTWS